MGKNEGDDVARQRRAQLTSPFDGPHGAVRFHERLFQKAAQLLGGFHAVRVEVVERGDRPSGRAPVLLAQGERWADDGLCDAKPLCQSLYKSGFPAAKRSLEEHDGPGAHVRSVRSAEGAHRASGRDIDN